MISSKRPTTGLTHSTTDSSARIAIIHNLETGLISFSSAGEARNGPRRAGVGTVIAWARFGTKVVRKKVNYFVDNENRKA
jgi:hypothetical protein